MAQETITANVPVEVPAPPAQITFGWKSFWHKPTPEIASTVFNFILAGASSVGGIVAVLPLQDATKVKILAVSGAAVLVSRIICKAFGITIKDVDPTTGK